MKSIGTQIAIDMYNCSDLLLSDASGVQATIQSAAADFAMQPRETYINCEEGINEYSVFSHCKQGHVTCIYIRILALSLLMFSPVSKMPTQTD